MGKDEYEDILGLGDREHSLDEFRQAITNFRQYLDRVESHVDGLLIPVTITTIAGRIREAEQILRANVDNDLGRRLDPAPSDIPQIQTTRLLLLT